MSIENPLYNANYIDEAVDFLTNKLKTLANENFPPVRCSRKCYKDKPWLNGDLKKRFNVKNNLFIKSKRSDNPDNNLIYTAFRNKLEKDIETYQKNILL